MLAGISWNSRPTGEPDTGVVSALLHDLDRLVIADMVDALSAVRERVLQWLILDPLSSGVVGGGVNDEGG
jgi:hypothetical protein